MAEEFRFDRGQFGPNWEKTPEGFLRVKGTFSRTGCQTYQRADGSTVVEYRPEEEVASTDSIASLGGLPVTLEHPPELLNPLNVRQHQRGSTGTVVNYDNGFVQGTVTITDAEAIRFVEDARARGDAVELSLGYRVQVDPTPGMDSFGKPYDAVQRRISGNHLALTRKGRGGPKVRLHMDSAFSLSDPTASPTTSQQEVSMSEGAAVQALKDVGTALAQELGAAARADGGMGKKQPVMEMDLEDEMDPEDLEDPEELMEPSPPAPKKGRARSRGDSAVISKQEHDRIVNRLRSQLSASHDAHQADLGRLDALTNRLDELEAEIEQRTDSINLDSLVEERLELLERATDLAGQRLDFAGLSVRELQLSAMATAGHDVGRFDGKSDEYVEATFDLLLAHKQQQEGRIDHVEALEKALGSAPAKGAELNDPREAMEAQVSTLYAPNPIAAA